MKTLVALARIVVGLLFIISGFIKLNDPVGFSFKLEEYFSAPVLDLPFLEPYALAFALFVVVLEVMLGVTLLLGYRVKLTVWALLAAITFFTFLTLYSAVTGKVTDCGCFGDALKLTPWQSFYKDVALLGLIVLLVWKQQLIKPLVSPKLSLGVTLAALAACIWFANHVLNHLPWIDFRPYKIGVSIPGAMSVPEDAPKPVVEYAWTFNEGGEEKTYSTLGDYPQVNGEFVRVETTEIDPGYEPPIHDFTLERDGADYTQALLARKQLLMVISYDLARSTRTAFGEMAQLADSAQSLGYSVIGMSASSQEDVDALKAEFGLDIPFYFTDQTALKTIVRSNPAVLRLESGVIKQKLHYNDLEELQLPALSDEARYDLPLKQALDSILVLDQQYRAQASMETWNLQVAIDSANMRFVDSVITRHGYPGKTLVGEPANESAWYVIQHSNRIDEFLPQIEVAASVGELPFRLYAMMLDRSLMQAGKAQRYGTQGMSFFMGTPEEVMMIWPVEDPENIDAIRREAGFAESVEAYGKRLFGPAFEYKVYPLEEALELQRQYFQQ